MSLSRKDFIFIEKFKREVFLWNKDDNNKKELNWLFIIVQKQLKKAPINQRRFLTIRTFLKTQKKLFLRLPRAANSLLVASCQAMFNDKKSTTLRLNVSLSFHRQQRLSLHIDDSYYRLSLSMKRSETRALFQLLRCCWCCLNHRLWTLWKWFFFNLTRRLIFFLFQLLLRFNVVKLNQFHVTR